MQTKSSFLFPTRSLFIRQLLILLSSLILIFSIAYSASAKGENTLEYATDTLIVKSKYAGYDWKSSSLFKNYNVQLVQRYPKNRLDVIQLKDSKTSVEKLKAALEASGEYEYVNYNYYLELTKTVSPSDQFWSNLWHLQNIGQYGIGRYGKDIDIMKVWEEVTGSQKVIVAVIDTGVDFTHTDLRNNIWTNPGEIPANGIDDDQNGYIDDIRGIDTGFDDVNPMDIGTHGTHVCGIIGAQGNNAVGTTGVLWNASILPIQSFTPRAGGRPRANIADLIESFNYLVWMKTVGGHNIKVLNMSLGGYGDPGQAFRDALQAVSDAGILIVCAAGNGGNDGVGDNLDRVDHIPGGMGLENMITVANTTIDDELNSSSNFGQLNVDIAAPGTSIYSTLPNQSYGWRTGTSMASPIVAGAAALLWSADRGLSIKEVKSAILNGAEKSNSLKTLTASDGRLNIYNSLLLIKKPTLANPSISNPIEGESVWFSWDDNGKPIQNWYLRVGSSKGGRDYFDSGILDANQVASLVEGLPTNGSTVYTTLYWFADGSWNWRYYEHSAIDLQPALTSHVNGAILSGKDLILAWDANDHNVTRWSISVETEAFAGNIASENNLPDDAFGYWVQDLPQTGETVYVRLGWEIAGQWEWKTYEFTLPLGDG